MTKYRHEDDEQRTTERPGHDAPGQEETPGDGATLGGDDAPVEGEATGAEPFGHTIDWDDYWRASGEPRADEANASAELALEPLVEFVEQRGVPDAVADVGCGGGALAVALAERYPETTVVGYDAAESVVAENTRHAAAGGPSNVSFERAVLPAFEPNRQFDLVTCLFTLCYVADVERALRNLYDAVAPGGHLVVHYHNRLASAHYAAIAEDPHEHLDDDAAWDPDTFPERFQLVVAGENLLSYERIHEVLGTWPQSVFSVTTGADRYGAHRYEPLVFVPK